jgi:hypothetical protein
MRMRYRTLVMGYAVCRLSTFTVHVAEKSPAVGLPMILCATDSVLMSLPSKQTRGLSPIYCSGAEQMRSIGPTRRRE